MSTTFLEAPSTESGAHTDRRDPGQGSRRAEHRLPHSWCHIAPGDVHDAKGESLCVGEAR